MEAPEKIIGRSVWRYARVSPSKLKRVLSELKGLTFSDASTILAFLPYKSCSKIYRLLKSARANYNFIAKKMGSSTPQAPEQESRYTQLVITKAASTKGPPMKRMRPAARGRGWQFLRRTSHVTIEVTGLAFKSEV